MQAGVEHHNICDMKEVLRETAQGLIFRVKTCVRREVAPAASKPSHIHIKLGWIMLRELVEPPFF
jgi:hypothetical protein